MQIKNKAQRQEFILAELRIKSFVDYSLLSQALGISEDTIRRDINELADKGLIRKIKGGAEPKSVVPISFREREVLATPEKGIIADKAKNIFKEDQIVMFDGGTTPFLVATALPHNIKLTVITHSFPIANLFLGVENIETIFIGGIASKKSLVTTGIKTYQEYSTLHADVCVLGMHSFHYKYGITDPNYEEAMVKNMMCSRSDQIIAVATSERINQISTHQVCCSEDVDILITELSPNEQVLRDFNESNINVI